MAHTYNLIKKHTQNKWGDKDKCVRRATRIESSNQSSSISRICFCLKYFLLSHHTQGIKEDLIRFIKHKNVLSLNSTSKQAGRQKKNSTYHVVL